MKRIHRDNMQRASIQSQVPPNRSNNLLRDCSTSDIDDKLSIEELKRENSIQDA